MKTTERLLEAAKDIWSEYYDHPFVRGLGDGTLDKEKFRFYTIQDYLYLVEYTRVFAVGIEKARDTKTMIAFAEYISQITNGEMNIHNGYMGKMNISLEELNQTRPSLANVSYTSYMLSQAMQGGAAEAAAAILSCAVSYEYIAQDIVRRNPSAAADPFYGEWVQGYSSKQYHDENIALCMLVNELTADYTEGQIEHLIEIFVNCSRYEKMFWDMAWKMEM